MTSRWTRARGALTDGVVIGLAALLTYWLTTTLLSRVYSPSPADSHLGGLWAVVATVFVMRGSYDKSAAAGVSRLAATLLSLVLCLAYLAFLPFHLWGLAVLVGLSSLAASLIGRPEDAITAAITTAVVLIVAEVSPHEAWRQPILRFADTVVGVAVGLAVVWVSRRTVYHWQRDEAAETGDHGAAGPAPGPRPSR